MTTKKRNRATQAAAAFWGVLIIALIFLATAGLAGALWKFFLWAWS